MCCHVNLFDITMDDLASGRYLDVSNNVCV